MKQEYHANAVTNIHIGKQIKESNLTNVDLASAYNTSVHTIRKWKDRVFLEDKSSRPKNIKYALSELQISLIRSIRTATWLPLDEVCEMLWATNPDVTRTAVYRTFTRLEINKVPEPKKEKAKKFKEYEPGFLHIDVTYMPKLNGIKYYLFVAIDRATRALFYYVYDAKTAQNAEDFMDRCLVYFPHDITHVLTDNGLEFTNRLIRSKKGNLCQKPSKLDDICENNAIKHRLTKPCTPQTNGMVERVNQTIKKGTILKETYHSLEEMNLALTLFQVHYMLYRRHGGLRKELNVKTPFQAIEKWFELKPEIFNQNPQHFKQKLLNLQQNSKMTFHIQPRET